MDIAIPADAPNPSTTTVNFALHSIPAGTYTIKAIINKNEITRAVNVLNCNDNPSPIADAGSDQSVKSGDTVQLDGSKSSDPTNSPLSYSWSQTDGPNVTLDNPALKNPTFTAPATTKKVNLSFQLVVSNEAGKNSIPDEVMVSVNPITTPPHPSDAYMQKLIDIINSINNSPKDPRFSLSTLNDTLKLLIDSNPKNDQNVCKVLSTTRVLPINTEQANVIQKILKC